MSQGQIGARSLTPDGWETFIVPLNASGLLQALLVGPQWLLEKANYFRQYEWQLASFLEQKYGTRWKVGELSREPRRRQPRSPTGSSRQA